MSMCQGSRRIPNTVIIGAGWSYATDELRLGADVESRGHSPEVPARKVGSPKHEAWRQYALAVAPLSTKHIYHPSGTFLDWEMGLGMPFAGTYAPPVGLVAGGSA